MNFDLSTTACFTGHRPNGFGPSNKPMFQIQKEISSLLRSAITYLYDNGYRTFISGGALGVDQWAAYEVIDLRNQDPDVKLIVAKPFPSQDIQWPEYARKEFEIICASADEVIDVSPDPYATWKMHARNSFMVDKSSAVVAVKIPDVMSGGTASCCAYAERKGKNIIYIDPHKQTISYPNMFEE